MTASPIPTARKPLKVRGLPPTWSLSGQSSTHAECTSTTFADKDSIYADMS